MAFDFTPIIVCLVALGLVIAMFVIADVIIAATGGKSGRAEKRGRLPKTSKPSKDDESDYYTPVKPEEDGRHGKGDKKAKADKDKNVTNEQEYINELNQNNLYNDVESLIDKDKKNDSVKDEYYNRKDNVLASRRSHLVNRVRMREYYQQKHAQHEKKYSDYGVDTEIDSIDEVYSTEASDGDNSEYGNGGINIDGLKFTDEELRKLIALQEVFKRKDS